MRLRVMRTAILALVSVAMIPANAASTVVASGNSDGSRYELRSMSPSNWDLARIEAAALGGHLVTITSEEENDFVFGVTQQAAASRQCNSRAWIGAEETGTEGVYAWITGESFDYTNWRPGEPNNGLGRREEDVAEMCFGSPGTGCCLASAWNDLNRNVSDLGFFLVEYALDEDSDGVPDDADACSGTVGGDVVDETGCSVAQLCPCDDFPNHGRFQSCNARVVEDFVQAGLLSEAEGDAIVSSAARSSCGKPQRGRGRR